MQPSRIRRVVLNGEPAAGRQVRAMVRAIGDARILVEKGGFLLRAAVDGETLALAVIPCIINGARTHHYEMPLPVENAGTLMGGVTAEGAFTLLFRPESVPVPPAQVAAVADTAVQLARFLLEHGYAGPGPLDGVTQGCFAEIAAFAALPSTLADLAGQDGSHP